MAEAEVKRQLALFRVENGVLLAPKALAGGNGLNHSSRVIRLLAILALDKEFMLGGEGRLLELLNNKQEEENFLALKLLSQLHGSEIGPLINDYAKDLTKALGGPVFGY